MKNLLKKGISVSLCTAVALFSAANITFAASNYSYGGSSQNYSSLQGQVVYVPVGITTSAILSQTLSSQTSVEGMNVYATLNKDFTYNGTKVAPKGSILNGTIVKCKKAGIGNRNGQIQVRFTSLRTPQGYMVPISAVIATSDGSGILKGGTAKDSGKDYAKNVAVGAAGGAVLGTVMGPLSGGKVGKGAVYGTAVGSGLGLINAARQSGEEVEIPANAVVDVYFDQPITISAPNGY